MKLEDGGNSALRNVRKIQIFFLLNLQNALRTVADAEISVFIQKRSDVFSPTCLIMTDACMI